MTDHAIEAIRQVQRASVSIGLFTDVAHGLTGQHDATREPIDAVRTGECLSVDVRKRAAPQRAIHAVFR